MIQIFAGMKTKNFVEKDVYAIINHNGNCVDSQKQENKRIGTWNQALHDDCDGEGW